MPIKITNKTLAQSLQAIEEINSLDAPAVLTFKFGKLRRDARAEVELYQAALKKLQEKFTKKNENGEPERVVDPVTSKVIPNVFLPTDAGAYQAELKALDDLEVTINLDPVKVSALGDLKIKGFVFDQLHWYIQE